MKTRLFIVVALIMAVGVSLPSSIQARDPHPSNSRTSLRDLPREARRIVAEHGQQIKPARISSSSKVRVILELEDSPAIDVYLNQSEIAIADATTASRNQIATIEQAQQRILAQLSGLQAQVLYRTQRVFNGIAIQVDANKLAQIAKLKGVKAIYPSVSVKPANSTSVPFIGADKLWSTGVITATGKNIKIGIIDTGVDYIHTDFGGSGASSDYDRNNVTHNNETPALFPSVKVVGGYDFVGDDFDSTSDDPNKQIPTPDPDPMDCDGHGTHVAGTAAGYGVKSDGSTYNGPYTDSLVSSDFKIGPGVAPEASIYALKVFGCEGSSDIIAPAIEYAVDPNGDGDFSDRLDVINMSLGAESGSSIHADAIASNRAANLGVIVVVAAGNSGDSYYIMGSPGSAEQVITVAASVDDGLVFSAIQVNAPADIAGNYIAADADFGPKLTPTGVTEDLVAAQPANACSPLSNAASIAGKIALIDRGTCTFVEKVKAAQTAGAVGVVVVNNQDGDPVTMGGDDATITIPSVMISKADGDTIKAQLGNGVNVTLSSDITTVRPELGDTLATFSSRGPAAGNSWLKPDIAAPGLSIISAASGTGNGEANASGTSMATPHVAGAMALLRQLHPNWSVEELKALAMNTATNDVRTAAADDSIPFGPGRIGAGRIDLVNARDAQVIAFNDTNDGTVSVSFGALEITQTTTLSKQVKVVNKSLTPQSYSLSYLARAEVPGVSYTISPTSVDLGPGASSSVTVTLTANPAQMKHSHDPSVNEAPYGLPSQWLSEAAGYLLLQSNSAPTLRVPVHSAPRPASRMHAPESSLNLAGFGVVTSTIALTGTALIGENPPLDYQSLASAFELQYTSPVSSTTVGKEADLHYIGIANSLRATATPTEPLGVLEDAYIYFAITTHQDWSSPHQVEFDIYIDTDQDGVEDFILFDWNYGNASGAYSSGSYISVLYDIALDELFLADFINGFPDMDTGLFNSNVMVLGVAASDLGLSAESPQFDYKVVSYSTERADGEFSDDIVIYGDPIDETPVLSYNAAQPGISTGNPDLDGMPFYNDQPDTVIPIEFNAQHYQANNSQGLLLLHHHNTKGRRAEVLAINSGTRILMPLVFKAEE
jgi:subtilisin family serine protease